MSQREYWIYSLKLPLRLLNAPETQTDTGEDNGTVTVPLEPARAPPRCVPVEGQHQLAGPHGVGTSSRPTLPTTCPEPSRTAVIQTISELCFPCQKNPWGELHSLL